MYVVTFTPCHFYISSLQPFFCSTTAIGVAMTGEVTLTGRVLVIGGVKEKTLAARRGNVFKLMFPAENRRDWDELQDFVTKDVDVRFADAYDDVFRVAFPELADKLPADKPFAL
jgi:ATP-dependent Lon protease